MATRLVAIFMRSWVLSSFLQVLWTGTTIFKMAVSISTRKKMVPVVRESPSGIVRYFIFGDLWSRLIDWILGLCFFHWAPEVAPLLSTTCEKSKIALKRSSLLFDFCESLFIAA